MRWRNPPTHDAAAQVRFSSTGLTRTTSWSEKIMSVVGLLVIKPMSQMGQKAKSQPVCVASGLPPGTDIGYRGPPETATSCQSGRLSCQCGLSISRMTARSVLVRSAASTSATKTGSVSRNATIASLIFLFERASALNP
jgi:hypothetical protein